MFKKLRKRFREDLIESIRDKIVADIVADFDIKLISIGNIENRIALEVRSDFFRNSYQDERANIDVRVKELMDSLVTNSDLLDKIAESVRKKQVK